MNEHTISVGADEPVESATPSSVEATQAATTTAEPAAAKPAKPAQKTPVKKQAAVSKPSATAVPAKTGASKAPKGKPATAKDDARKAIPSKKALVKWPEPAKTAAVAKRNGRGDAAAAPAEKDAAKPKDKLVRDSFTMPQRDFGLIAALKDRALDFKRPTKKSELLRAGLHALSALKPDDLKRALEQLTPIKAGRPKNPT